MGAAGDLFPQDQDLAGAVEPAITHLCAGHCRSDWQSDLTPSLTVPPVLLNALFGLPPLAGPAALPRLAVTETGKLAAASPPHAILHCCFRL